MGKNSWYVILLITILLVGAYKWTTDNAPSWRFAVTDLSKIDSHAPAKFLTVFDYTVDSTAHAPSVVVSNKDPNRFDLIWFQGSHEASKDVAVYRTSLFLIEGQWRYSKPKPFIYPADVGTALNPKRTIQTLGNTVQFGEDTNRYLITVISVGGWAMSSIALFDLSNHHSNESAEGATMLPLSPILNRSHLVRSPTISWQDGDIGLPAYFEMGTFYGTLIRMDENGKVKDQRAISKGSAGIQPVIVVLDDKQAVAFLRNFSDDEAVQGRLLASWTQDGGQSWSELERLSLPNPDSPVAALRLSNGQILLGFNDHETCSDVFRLALSSDAGHSWKRIATLEDHNCHKTKAARYPMMRRLKNGEIALTYSFNNKGGIRAYVFNEAWVNQQAHKAAELIP